MRRYRRKDWQEYRKEVIELDGGACVRCGRGTSEGAVLQVHHKAYLPGKLPWEYPYELCQTLCKGCHASEHGIIQPFTGWECFGDDDLGDLLGECELCGSQLRYVFFVRHPKWPALEVGETCCDHLTGTTEASDHRRLVSRQERFVASSRWKAGPDDILRISQKGVEITIEPVDGVFLLCMNGIKGKKRPETVVAAKILAFEKVEDGTVEAYLAKNKPNRRGRDAMKK